MVNKVVDYVSVVSWREGANVASAKWNQPEWRTSGRDSGFKVCYYSSYGVQARTVFHVRAHVLSLDCVTSACHVVR